MSIVLFIAAIAVAATGPWWVALPLLGAGIYCGRDVIVRERAAIDAERERQLRRELRRHTTEQQ